MVRVWSSVLCDASMEPHWIRDLQMEPSPRAAGLPAVASSSSKEKFQGFRDSMAAGFLTLEASNFFNELSHRRHRIAGSRDHRSANSIQHRQVIEVIACRKNRFARDLELSGDFSHYRSLVITSMAESRVDVVSHHREIRHRVAVALEILHDLVGFLIVGSDQTQRTEGIFIQRCQVPCVDPLDELRDIVGDSAEELLMFVRAILVPGSERAIVISVSHIDLPLYQSEVVRPDRQSSVGQRIHQTGEIATRVNNPASALTLQPGNLALEGARNGRRIEMGVESAVEIGGDELNF